MNDAEMWGVNLKAVLWTPIIIYFPEKWKKKRFKK